MSVTWRGVFPAVCTQFHDDYSLNVPGTLAHIDAMLAAGLIDEVRSLLDAGHGTARAMDAVGYAEARAVLEGRLAREELRDTIVRATRVFARKQRTWLKQAPVTWLGR